MIENIFLKKIFFLTFKVFNFLITIRIDFGKESSHFSPDADFCLLLIHLNLSVMTYEHGKYQMLDTIC